MVREEWYQWCEKVPYEELVRKRTGGAQGILQTLFHIIDVEWSWIRVLQGKTDYQENFDEYNTLEKIKQLDKQFHIEVEEFVLAWNDSMEKRPLINPREDGSAEVEAWGVIMRHIIAHEIHHIGQLSIWSREMGLQPISANVIRKGLIKPEITETVAE